MSDWVTCRFCGTQVDRLVEAQCRRDGTDLWSPDGVTDATEQPVPDERVKASGSVAALDRRLRVGVNGKEFLLADGEVGGLGRSADYPLAEYFANCDNVSRVHATIRFESGRVYLTDTDSANGTFVNGRKLPAHSEYEVQRGQRVRLAADVDLDLEWVSQNEPAGNSDGRTRIEGA